MSIPLQQYHLLIPHKMHFNFIILHPHLNETYTLFLPLNTQFNSYFIPFTWQRILRRCSFAKLYIIFLSLFFATATTVANVIDARLSRICLLNLTSSFTISFLHTLVHRLNKNREIEIMNCVL
jgi:hypothetical protein